MTHLRMTFLLALCVTLCGCPASVQQQAAQASDNAMIALQAAQNVELSVHKQGLISNQDDIFIQTQFKSIANIDTTANTCIRSANNTGAAVTCLNSAINSVDQINSQGGLYLKSATAQQYFQLGVNGFRDVVAAIDTAIGGTPPQAPISASAVGVSQ